MTWVGRTLPRLEDPTLLKGGGRFTADLKAGAWAVKFVRSPEAAGTIVEVERPDEGIVFTAEDLDAAGVGSIQAVLDRPDYRRVPHPVLARDRVVFAGQAVALVVAPTEAEAEDLAEQVFVDIDTEDAVTSIEAALAEGARDVHPEAPGNVMVEGVMRTPGVDAAFDAAACVVELDLSSARQSAMPMETRGGVADYDPATGRVTLYASVQMPHMLRTGLADVLGIDEGDLRVVAPDVGGGFGQKMSLFPEYVALVWTAFRLRRKVAWIEDRRENFLSASHARDQQFTVRGAFDAEGRLLAVDADLRSNVGAFSCYPVTCGVEPLMAFAELPGPYDFAEYGVRSRGVTTNLSMMAPYRGVARPMLTLSMEQLMDAAAEKLDLDPVEIRRRNLITSFPHTSPTGLVYDEASYLEAMEAAVTSADIPGFRERQAAALAEGRYLGLGLSVFSERTGYGTPAFAARKMQIVPGYETVDCEMGPSGQVTLRIGASPHGQGLKTALAQLLADQLGVAPERIRVISGDTDASPYGWGTFASRSMVISGGASKIASGQLADKLRAIAGVLLEVDPSGVELKDGLALATGTNKSLSIAEVARAAHHQSHRFEGMAPGLKEQAFYDPSGTFSNAAHVCEVELDPETCGVRITRFLVVEDAGRLINPMIVDGQIAGGVAQGIATALYEELVFDEFGTMLTTSLADYLPPTAAEIPDIEIIHMETISPQTVTEAKGVGEGGTIGAPAAVLSALNDALRPFGTRITSMPATPDRIAAALRAARTAAAEAEA
ncbi:xanthine dehydrogenase family protein molybdopterin-binding subunit [Roseisalinus antarcticus]|uniref:Caffeine dehydrogenase subunit alpha n=1 Tax=Roseisalinus antarcticus TaxID=254357 RepID=A0A1Y5TS05_9RHOB|nr:xanthine dehydrogenase family protein molybdopterin-binding subunit [Roseisalinus antarcticus]SLN70662.1 Caffeine dehydrogenase subunit alpha [Roseisalinus antarcticus]